MKRAYYCYLSLFTFSYLISSCGPPLNSGKKITTNTSVSSFSSVDIEAPVKTSIDIVKGATPSLQITGPESQVKMIKYKVEGNALKLYTESNMHFDWDDDIVAHIVLPTIEGVNMGGAGSTDITGIIAADSFSIDISGVGKVNIASVNVKTLYAEVSGAGKLNIKSGKAETCTYELSGTGYIDAFNVQAGNAAASVSGAGYINLSALQSLTSDISGVGTVRYKGHPVVTSSSSGVGRLSDAN
ncbi:MAG: DUF2807 domain-containing protein [Taibaiella sp.]|nr:DUF2807 domain-containing protein [Taibaiella sp.]